MLFKKLRLAYVVAVITWGLLSYLTLFDYLRQGEMFARLLGGRPYINDFVNTYSASQFARECLVHKVNVYDPAIQDAAVRKLVAPVVPDHPFYFQYPPHYFLYTLPLSFVPISVAWVLWNVVLFSLAAFCIFKSSSELPKLTRAALIAIAFASYPWWISAQLGQTSLIVFPLVALFFWSVRERKFALAGIATALLSVKLQYLPPFGMIGLVVGGLPFLIAVAAVAALLLGATTLVLGWQNVIGFPEALAIGETGKYFTGVNPFMMQNLRGELWLFTHGEGTFNHIVAMAAFGLGALAVGYMWWKQYKLPSANGQPISDSRFQVLCVVSILVALLTSPHTHTQDYVLITIPLIWLWRQLAAMPKEQRSRRQSAAYQLVFWFPLLSWLFLFLQPLSFSVFLQPFFCWAVVLLILIMPVQKKYADAGNGDG